MARQIAFLLCTLALSSASIAPRDLAEEVEHQLQQLISIVQGEILAAHNNLDDLGSEFIAASTNTYEDSAINVQQEYETVKAQLTTVVDLAVSAGYDVSSCTNYGEDALQRLAPRYTLIIYECISNVNAKSVQLINDATYVIDVIMTKVRNLERQLQSCRGDILCLSPLVTEIELYKISLVQDIEKEVQTADNEIALLGLSVDTCAESNTASFIVEASSILSDITECINRILG